MSREPIGLQGVEWEPCTLERVHDPEITHHVRSQLGFVPDHLDYFTPCPWLARQFRYWDGAGMPIRYLDPGLGEMIANVVAQDNSCRYCYAATRVMLRMLGFDDDTVRILEQDLLTSDLPPATRASLDLARRLSHGSPLPDERELGALRDAGLGDQAILEVVYLIGFSVLANRVITLAAVPIEKVERLAERRWMRLLSPLAGIVLRRRRRRRRRRRANLAIQPVADDAPFANVVRAFDEHPLGARLRAQIDEAWTSTILPRRTKALIAAVVERALGCAQSESEGRRLLALAEADFDLDPVLDHLGSPALSDAEAEIVPFVRETVHYNPAQIQRRARALNEKIGQAAFLEVVGVAALANALCRMGAVLRGARPSDRSSASASGFAADSLPARGARA